MADTLIRKLTEVYKIVDHVEKRGTNSAQGYKYVKASDLAHAVRNALADLGVYAEINLITERTYSHERKDKGPMYFADVRATITFRSPEDGVTITASGLGSGMDAGDKAIFKAQTGAIKYALRNSFLVPDDSDPENEEPEPEVKKVGSGKHYKHGEAPAGTNSVLIDPPTKAAQVPKAEIPSEPLGKPTAQPGETDRPKPVSSSIPMDGALPNDEQLQSIRNRFSLLNKDLADAGLKPSKGLPIGRKLTLYLLHRTAMPDAEKVTYAQWQKFFEECAANKSDGFKNLVEHINLIVEEKK